MSDETTEQPKTDTDGWEWMLVEIMGHRTHWGRAAQQSLLIDGEEAA